MKDFLTYRLILTLEEVYTGYVSKCTMSTFAAFISLFQAVLRKCVSALVRVAKSG